MSGVIAAESAEFENLSPLEQLVCVMAMLRHPEHGCPWDLEQSIESLLPHTLEEAYEVADAIESGDRTELRDELGDLLFQVVFYAQLASEEGSFGLDDIARTITGKLIRRHPHVFPGGKVTDFGQKPDISAAEVVVNWEQIKQAEKREKRRHGGTKNSVDESILADVPRALPAMERSRKLQDRAAAVGFDWPEIASVIAKLREELNEFECALRESDQSAVEHELGDILTAAVNLARHARLEPEIALRRANRRFERRFGWIEQALKVQGKSFAETGLKTLDRLWEQAKEQGL